MLLMFAAGRLQAACGLSPYMTFSDSCTVFSFKGANIPDTSRGTPSPPACLTYSWNFGDGTTATGASVTHTYATEGTYTICLTITDICSGCSVTTCETVTTLCPPPCSHMPGAWLQTDSCSSIYFDGNNPTHPRTGPYEDPCLIYTWNFGDGSTAKGKNVRHEYATKGTYNVCMNVSDTCRGCDTTICKTITIDCISNCAGIPKNWTYDDKCATIEYTGGDPDAALGMGLKYRDSCLLYSWNFGDGTSGTGRLASHTYTSNGSYRVSLRIQDTCRGCDTVISKKIKVSCQNLCGLPDGWRSTDTCGTYTFTSKTAPVAGCIVYTWDFGDGSTGSGSSIRYSYTKTGKYTVCLNLSDPCTGCDTTHCQLIEVLCVRSGLSLQDPGDNTAEPQLFPNPASGSFMLLSPGENSYKIVDAYGRTVSSGQFTNKTTLSGEGLSSGLYLVYIRNKQQSSILKLLLSK
ncbi:MAG: PKD domain-containing protein [Chitinophagaceae bacterium]|nr:PKD domain-containing protein [Chitinophagaceae bacterium]